MSVLIKGIRKTDCSICVVGNRTICANGCRMVEVPPHGRLIDADELQRQFERMANEEWNKNIAVSAASCFDDAAAAVEDAPTIIEAEK